MTDLNAAYPVCPRCGHRHSDSATCATIPPDPCDECGHTAYEHEEREWDGAAAACKLCWCEDFDNSLSDESRLKSGIEV